MFPIPYNSSFLQMYHVCGIIIVLALWPKKENHAKSIFAIQFSLDHMVPPKFDQFGYKKTVYGFSFFIETRFDINKIELTPYHHHHLKKLMGTPNPLPETTDND